ncbi:AfsR/SARP family transcriptional regulator [Streptomyces odontomachi]|uniref:AfsR/SARP family transcriptional regulator n=1 Tax=Streptomyces odontomachi TaxID=2944940 RepID=UPI00210D4DD5|nr:tetratricopeptide repeat protein [Streptomyces sp. ODS25]
MRYRILGTTQAFRPDGTLVPVGGARLRALLTVLALRPGRTVPASVLVDEVWGVEPPADAMGALQALVGRLRRAIGASALASEEGGYRLCATLDDVDAFRFERMATEGARALADGDAQKAAGVLDDALALWHGPALADLPDRGAEAARWETRRHDVRRGRLEAALALGQAEQALPELTALCDAHPFEEPLQVLRLRALRDAGRSAEALAAYEDIRRALASRLGTDPGPELRALHAALLTPDSGEPVRPGQPGQRGMAGRSGSHPGQANGHPSHPARQSHFERQSHPEPPPDPAQAPGATPATYPAPAPDHAPGAPRTGTLNAPAHTTHAEAAPPNSAPHAPPAPTTDTELPAPTTDGEPPPTTTHEPPPTPRNTAAVPPPNLAGLAAPPPGNLRARLTSFVGREQDIVAIRRELGRSRLVTLLGPGGSGKTRLSQEAAEGMADAMPDGVWLAELAPVDDPDDPKAVSEAVVTALGARETVLRGAGAEELRAAADRHGDDPLVRLTEYCAPRRMVLLLDNCEHVVDSAARLAAQLLERCPRLTVLATSREPLGVPGEVLYPVEPLPEPVAMRLLDERGAAARPGFRSADDPEAVAEICRRLDGLPLAIELAAARLRLLTPRQIADRLDDRFRLLTSGARTVLPRQQTLRAVVDWSWELLDASERAVLRRLAVFAGGCDLAAAEAVCGPDALDALGSLVDKSLVVAAPAEDGRMRYRLLETVAEYAAERLDEAGDRTAAERAHLVHYRELARTTDADLRGPGQLAAIAALTADYENLRTALRCAIAAGDEQEALCLVLSLCWYWQIHDLRHEARTWSLAVAELGPDPFAEPLTPAPALHERCTAAPPPMRPELLEEARRGAHLVHLACMDMEIGRWQTPEAQQKLRAITQVYRPGLPQTCSVPGSLWFFAVILTGEFSTLTEILEANIRTCRTLDLRWELAMALQMRANLLANRSDLAGDANRDADESLTIFTSLGDSWGMAEALSARAEARERRGDFAGAADDYRAAMAHTERLGAHSQVAVLTVRLASALVELGEEARGETMLRTVLETHRHSSGNEAIPAGRLFLALLLSRTGRVPEAREHIRLMREGFPAAGFAVFDGFVASIEAWLDMADGRYAEGLERTRQAIQKALDPLARLIAPQMMSIQLAIGAFGHAHVEGGAQARNAALLLGAAWALLPQGHHPNVLEREVSARVEATARAVLGDAEYDAAHAEGGGLSVEEAAALL